MDTNTINTRKMVMEFLEYIAPAIASIDIVTSWQAMNAAEEVDIILNTRDEFELWIGGDFYAKYDTFDLAKRNAETMVPFRFLK